MSKLTVTEVQQLVRAVLSNSPLHRRADELQILAAEVVEGRAFAMQETADCLHAQAELRATREVIAGFVRDCQASPTTALVAKELTNRLEAALEAKGGDK